MGGCIAPLSALLLAFYLTGCAAKQLSVSPGPSVEARQQVLRAVQQFNVNGGIGVWTDDTTISARMRWQQRFDDFNLMLSGPGGLGSLTLAQTGNNARLQRGVATPVTGKSADKLLQQALGLGVAVPVDQLSKWMLGLPGDGTNATYDSQGLLRSLEYRDDQGTRWRAKIRKYGALESMDVPALITAEGGPYNVRIVLQAWDMNLAGPDPAQTNPADSTVRLRVPKR